MGTEGGFENRNGGNTTATPLLDLDRAEVERTLSPLERASMLPPRAFTSQSVFEWELENIYRDRWICFGHVSQVKETGQYLMREIGDDSDVTDNADSPYADFRL